MHKIDKGVKKEHRTSRFFLQWQGRLLIPEGSITLVFKSQGL